MPNYKCIFFDLDHTLWDYETNSAETLQELFHQHKLHEKGIDTFADFQKTFAKINADLWYLYDVGRIHRNVIRYERFHKILLQLGIDDYELSLTLSSDYVAESPKKRGLMPNAVDLTASIMYFRRSLRSR